MVFGFENPSDYYYASFNESNDASTRGTALGVRNLTHYMTRALLDCGGFRPALHRLLR